MSGNEKDEDEVKASFSWTSKQLQLSYLCKETLLSKDVEIARGNIFNLRYGPNLKGNEIWDAGDPPQEMVWEVCHHIDRTGSLCKRCPALYELPPYGLVQYGCYAVAAKACRVVFAMQRRLSGSSVPEA